MNLHYGSIAFYLATAALYLRIAHGMRKEQCDTLRNSRILVHDLDGSIARVINKKIRAYALVAIANALLARALINVGSRNLA